MVLINLYKGDCFDIIPTLEKNSVDMIKMLKEKDIKKNVSGFELCFDIVISFD